MSNKYIRFVSKWEKLADVLKEAEEHESKVWTNLRVTVICDIRPNAAYKQILGVRKGKKNEHQICNYHV